VPKIGNASGYCLSNQAFLTCSPTSCSTTIRIPNRFSRWTGLIVALPAVLGIDLESKMGGFGTINFIASSETSMSSLSLVEFSQSYTSYETLYRYEDLLSYFSYLATLPSCDSIIWFRAWVEIADAQKGNRRDRAYDESWVISMDISSVGSSIPCRSATIALDLEFTQFNITIRSAM
jgi:hypothetical protein